jgi:hypothetical protein
MGKVLGRRRGSYAAWTIYYLNWVDPNFAQDQYQLLKNNFAVRLPFGLATLREYPRGYDGPVDVDSGPVIFWLSTSGTGFMIAGARLSKDADYLQGLVTTAEFVGSSMTLKIRKRLQLRYWALSPATMRRFNSSSQFCTTTICRPPSSSRAPFSMRNRCPSRDTS